VLFLVNYSVHNLPQVGLICGYQGTEKKKRLY